MKYRILAVVDAENLGAAITAIQPYLAEPIQVTADQTQKSRRPQITLPLVVAASARPSKVTPAAQTRLGRTVLDLLERGQATAEEVSVHIRSYGFAGTSVSPIMSKLAADGMVERFTTSLNGSETRVYKLVGSPAAAAGGSSPA